VSDQRFGACAFGSVPSGKKCNGVDVEDISETLLEGRVKIESDLVEILEAGELIRIESVETVTFCGAMNNPSGIAKTLSSRVERREVESRDAAHRAGDVDRRRVHGKISGGS
jgi:hypothetical protein